MRRTALFLVVLPLALAGVRPAHGGVMTFDNAGDVTTGPSQAPGVWYTDRYAPASFASGMTAPDGRMGTLEQGISAGDSISNRPGSYNSAFYNTQGRKYDLDPGTISLSIELYVPQSWDSLDQTQETDGRLASLWATAVDGSNAVSAFPIIEFNNQVDGFRVWNQAGFWDNVGGFSGYDKWYQIGFNFDGTDFTYFVNGAAVYSDTGIFGTVDFDNVILQGYNDGESYDIYWDNLAASDVIPEPTSLALFGLALGSAGLYGARRRKGAR